MQFSKTIRRAALIAAGMGLSTIGSVSSAHAFNFTETTDAGSTQGAAINVGAFNYSVQPNIIQAAFNDASDLADVFQFSLNPGTLGGLAFSLTSFGSQGNPVLNNATLLLRNSTFGVIASGSSGPQSQITVPALPTGTYYFEVLRGSSTPFLPGQTAPSSFTYAINASLAPSAVPEPFTILGGAAALGMGGMMQRKRKKRQLVAEKAD